VTLETLWYAIITGMLTGYVVFDGFDLGVGILHKFVARTDAERRACLRSIGPVWDGNEVWLIAAGGALLFAFPRLYAVSFSGFYLPLMMVLWLLVLRALAIELRHHVANQVWQPFWDTVFAGASAALALFFGVALGCVIRGVPLAADGTFFAPLWTDLRASTGTGILDWYTLLVGVTATAALALHGALWLGWRVGGDVRARCDRLVPPLGVAVALLVAGTTAATVWLHPAMLRELAAAPWGAPLPALALAGLAVIARSVRAGRRGRAFAGSAAFLVGMIGSAAFELYPFVLRSTSEVPGLTAADAASSAHGLAVGLGWWVPGIALVAVYFVYNYRQLPAQIDPNEHAPNDH